MRNELVFVEKKTTLVFCVVLWSPCHHNDVTGGQRGVTFFSFLWIVMPTKSLPKVHTSDLRFFIMEV